MTDPNSPLTRARQWLATRLQPHPDPGEAWCVRCVLSGRRTLVLSPDATTRHERAHGEHAPEHEVLILTSLPGDGDGGDQP